MNRESNVAFPSRRDIANGCGIRKEETVDKAIKSLLEKGLIEKYHRRFIDRREMNVEFRYCTNNFYRLSQDLCARKQLIQEASHHHLH